ncbi:MAG TPA: 16S rRNA (guanine(966)-N(2))-methyltransferase RsmD [Planctomycetes bacterium]|jgi:16S rRNA (guanine(966)-N(2))-methyltransferase RsmD|nr:16S rRNA (guanine(966)-N(2))-methyltransferase RsmD [Planctomycetota bacterium]
MLRITAGEHRGRKLKVPKVAATRPLVERAREGVFNHLSKIIEGAVVWDVYAGSGILGLESLSRGASQVIAVEYNQLAVAQIKENAELIHYSDKMRALKIDAYRMPGLAESEAAPNIVFFDPPYADFRDGGPKRLKVWQLFLDLADVMTEGGCAVVHTPKGLLLDTELEKLPGIERRDYGSASLYWWHKPSAATE